jgi:hypothetical protein
MSSRRRCRTGTGRCANTLAQGGKHRRTPDIAASLILSWEIFLRFAEETGAIDTHGVASTFSRVRAALTDSAEAQRVHQASEEPAARFLALLRAAISSGRAHVADMDTGGPPEDAARWGWQFAPSGDHEREAWRPHDERLGWIGNGDLLLDPDAAFAAAQKLARDQGTAIAVRQRTLWKRLAEQGLLASRDSARGTSTVRRTIEGMRRDLLHLRTSALAAGTDQAGDETDHPDETDHERGLESRGFPGPGQFGQFGQKTEHRGRERRGRLGGGDMIPPARGRAVLVGRLAHIANLHETYDSKTDQTAQTDHAIGNAWKFGAHLGQKLTSAHQKLTSGTAQQPRRIVPIVGAPLESARARPSDGAPQP